MVSLSPFRDSYVLVAAGNSLALNRGQKEEEVGSIPSRMIDYCMGTDASSKHFSLPTTSLCSLPSFLLSSIMM